MYYNIKIEFNDRGIYLIEELKIEQKINDKFYYVHFQIYYKRFNQNTF